MCWLWLTWTYSAVFWLLTLNPKWATNLYFQLYKWLNNFIKQLGTLALVGTIFRCALTHIWAVCKLLEQINISPSAALMCLKAFVETVSSFPTTEKITCREVKFAYRFLCVSVGVPLILGPLWWKNDNFCEACCSNLVMIEKNNNNNHDLNSVQHQFIDSVEVSPQFIYLFYF